MPSVTNLMDTNQAVKYGGRKEWEFAKSLYEEPTTPPSASISAMWVSFYYCYAFLYAKMFDRYAMCASQDMSCINDTFSYMLNNVRNQDVIYFFMGLQKNHRTRRSSADFFMKNFPKVGDLCATMPFEV